MLATYVDQENPGLEVQARQLSSGIEIGEDEYLTEPGDWLIVFPDGGECFCPNVDFQQQYQQKYPRLVDGERASPPAPHQAA